MITCMYCEAESDDEENNFCEKCFNPIKCINCRSLLKINTPICLKCGTSITLPNYNSTNTSNISPAVNKFILEEHQTNSSAYRRIEGEFTDEAIDKAAMMLGAGRISMKSNQVSNLIQQKALPIKQNNINNTTGNSDDDHIEEEIISQEEDFLVNNRSKAGKYFRVHGEDELIPKISDFKGKTKKEQQERFMMMIVWAYLDLFGKPIPSKEYILNALKRVKMYDGNFSHYFESISKSFFMNIDEGYELNPSGESKVEKFIEDIESNSYEGYVFKYESSKSSNRQARINKDEDNLIEELINSPINIGTIDVRNLSSIIHNAMFAIWSITKGIGKIQAVKIKVAYLYLIRRYKTVSVKQKGFTDTIIRSSNKNIFKENADGLYFLTEAAEREVENWISSGVIAKSIDLGGDKSE